MVLVVSGSQILALTFDLIPKLEHLREGIAGCDLIDKINEAISSMHIQVFTAGKARGSGHKHHYGCFGKYQDSRTRVYIKLMERGQQLPGNVTISPFFGEKDTVLLWR